MNLSANWVLRRRKGVRDGEGGKESAVDSRKDTQERGDPEVIMERRGFDLRGLLKKSRIRGKIAKKVAIYFLGAGKPIYRTNRGVGEEGGRTRPGYVAWGKKKRQEGRQHRSQEAFSKGPGKNGAFEKNDP